MTLHLTSCEPKPCPMCGGEAKIIAPRLDAYCVECSKCRLQAR